MGRTWDLSNSRGVSIGHLSQTGTVDEYREDFELLSGVLRNIPEDILEATFLKGLRKDIQAEVYALNPTGFEAIMAAAQHIERNLFLH
ncbi:unnamed protein product [Spirodela intermedia]|uniref:Uncharacterized protein n=2 Tax=Spirodela intermedia TaxID=51605 RepID=A0A7I8ILM5_SPIIN|nr:unnamed protein product [Spirodela intermedia]CAA6658836.1 unnamed protein product [Spirodela intermedia]CAA7395119.1 unnamed protein product [Spirodela intermedia]